MQIERELIPARVVSARALFLCSPTKWASQTMGGRVGGGHGAKGIVSEQEGDQMETSREYK